MLLSERETCSIKCVTVGDAAVGKTCLLTSYITKEFPSTDDVNNSSAIVDKSSTKVTVDGNDVDLELWDVAADSKTSYISRADVFILAFSLVSEASYKNVYKKWLPELGHRAVDVPIILVGTQQDLRENSDIEPISTAKGEMLKRMIGAHAYIECSAKTQQTVEDVFTEVIRAAPRYKKMASRSIKRVTVGDAVTVKCVIVGNPVVGKTCLFDSYTSNTFTHDWKMTVLENHDAVVTVGGNTVDLTLIDTPGDIYTRLRPLCYRIADAVIITFSLVCKASYENVSKYWLPEVKEYAPEAAIILVGTKLDLREGGQSLQEDLDVWRISKTHEPISTAQGEELKRKIGARAYIECSAKTHENVKDVIEAAVKVVLQGPEEKKNKNGIVQRTKRMIGTHAYIEYSAKTQQTVKDVFTEVIRAAPKCKNMVSDVVTEAIRTAPKYKNMVSDVFTEAIRTAPRYKKMASDVFTEAIRASPMYKKMASRSIKRVTVGDGVTVKCVIVGCGLVGKTCLLASYTSNTFTYDWSDLSSFEKYGAVVTVGGNTVNLELCDTPGQHEYKSIRAICGLKADVIILTFSLVCKTSYACASEDWPRELKQYSPELPIILVGTKRDIRDGLLSLREDIDIRRGSLTHEPISTAQGKQLKRESGASAYIECSAKTHENVKDVFDAAVMAYLQRLEEEEKKKNKKKKKKKKKNKKGIGQSRRACSVVKSLVSPGHAV